MLLIHLNKLLNFSTDLKDSKEVLVFYFIMSLNNTVRLRTHSVEHDPGGQEQPRQQEGTSLSSVEDAE